MVHTETRMVIWWRTWAASVWGRCRQRKARTVEWVPQEETEEETEETEKEEEEEEEEKAAAEVWT